MSENELQTSQADFSSHGQRAQSAVADATDDVKDKASDYGDQAQDLIDQGKTKAATVMSQAAGTIRDKTSSTGGIASDAGDKIASGMEKAASYTKDKSTSEMLDDVESYVKKHPGQAVVGAVVAGFLLGKIIF